MTTKKHAPLGSTRRTRRIVDRSDPKVRLLALVFATRDDEVKQGALKGDAATRVPPTIAKAVAKMLREIGEDPALGQDLVMTIGPSISNPDERQQHEAFVSQLSERLTQENPEDPLQGMTVVVQRQAQRIVGAEAAAVRKRSSASAEQVPPSLLLKPQPPAEEPLFPPTTRRVAPSASAGTRKSSKGRKAITPVVAKSTVVKPVLLTEVFAKAMAAALLRLSATRGAGFNQLTFLEQAMDGYQAAWAVEKRKSSQGLDVQAAREFEAKCGDIYRVLREELVHLGVSDATFTADDLYRILKSLVQKLGLIIESGGGHVRLKMKTDRRSSR